MPEYGLLVDYEYCTGCNACEVACKQEYNIAAGRTAGIRISESIEDHPSGKPRITYTPVLTGQCIFCAPRVKKGLLPACVSHCMAQCLTYGTIEDLAEKIPQGRKSIVWTQGKREKT